MAHRFVLHVGDEQQAFVNLIATQVQALYPRHFATSRVERDDEGELVVDADSEAEALRVVAAACDALVADCDAALASLGMSPEPPACFDAVTLPPLSVSTR